MAYLGEPQYVTTIQECFEMGTEFFVVMLKRRAGEIPADLHKTDLTIYLFREDAEAALLKKADLSGYFHVVRLVALTERDYSRLTHQIQEDKA